MHVAWSIRAVEAAMVHHGKPQHIHSDNGPEFIAYVLGDWLKENKIETIYIRPVRPGKTATSKASTTSSGMNTSTAKSSARGWKPKCSSNNGGWNITQTGLTARCGTRLHKRWPTAGRLRSGLRPALRLPVSPETSTIGQNYTFEVSHFREATGYMSESPKRTAPKEEI